ncbi:MAG: protein-export chaperone SecB [Spirochaetia bacterium]|jgi:preprotein translocase subunit SecB|nr:protein-export chaperone SecB [Spirochaetia bacterium]
MQEDKPGCLADLEFLSYKVDKIDFNVKNNTDVLQYKAPLSNFRFSFGIPPFESINDTNNEYKILICKFGIKLKAFASEKYENQLAEGEFCITGLFRIKKEIEHTQNGTYFEKYTMPAILFPYLRATITTTFATAGFGAIIFPLINVKNLVDDIDKSKKV